ncbi:class I SAM-dependent methyltransferase [Streptomyces sp. NPDC012825]|uniref:class I SAM-dependent methyltransferase n=1 Tax=Streptomyces sp. NPDC012825 TaxID=3364851 RepID=UPI0036B4BADB
MLTREDHPSPTEPSTWGFTASTGLPFTHQTIVDAHFRACIEPYRNLLNQAGIRPGMRVLDAGCCGGDFLPWLAELTGPHGRVSAIDLAEEHVTRATERVRSWHLPCPVDIRQGSITQLPYPDDSFDAVWCSNTVELLTDDELRAALREMRRITRPGGLVAIKDVDGYSFAARPGDPYLFTDLFRTAGATPGYAQQVLRTRDLYQWMRETGLHSIRQHTTLIEHFAPFTTDVRSYYAPAFAELAAQAKKLGLTSPDWDTLLDPAHPNSPFNHPDGYVCEGNTLAVGTA